MPRRKEYKQIPLKGRTRYGTFRPTKILHCSKCGDYIGPYRINDWAICQDCYYAYHSLKAAENYQRRKLEKAKLNAPTTLTGDIPTADSKSQQIKWGSVSGLPIR